MARIRINTRTHTKEKPYLINSYFFSKLVRQKKTIGWAKNVYVCVWDMCWRNFCNFPWWLENVKSRSKIALFSNERHFEIWFPKKRTIMFFWSKLSKLHKKDPMLHAATTFSLKQGETRTKHGPIPHPLRVWKFNLLRNYSFLGRENAWQENTCLGYIFTLGKIRVKGAFWKSFYADDIHLEIQVPPGEGLESSIHRWDGLRGGWHMFVLFCLLAY